MEKMNRLQWYRHLTGEFFHYAPRAVYRLVSPLDDRNPAMVETNYNARYQKALDNFRQTKPSIDKYLFGNAQTPEWTLVNNNIVWDLYEESYKPFLASLEGFLAPYMAAPDAVIIEFGCGNGRNLMYLKSRYPNVRFIGIELSPVGVELCREAARSYGLDIQFFQADLTKPIDLGLHATIAYSCFSLEQMPRAVEQAIANMVRTTGGKIILFEPVPELYSWDLRGITSRARAIVIDHVRHIISTLRSSGYTIEYAKRLGMGNPLTEACVVVAELSKKT